MPSNVNIDLIKRSIWYSVKKTYWVEVHKMNLVRAQLLACSESTMSHWKCKQTRRQLQYQAKTCICARWICQWALFDNRNTPCTHHHWPEWCLRRNVSIDPGSIAIIRITTRQLEVRDLEACEYWPLGRVSTLFSQACFRPQQLTQAFALALKSKRPIVSMRSKSLRVKIQCKIHIVAREAKRKSRTVGLAFKSCNYWRDCTHDSSTDQVRGFGILSCRLKAVSLLGTISAPLQSRGHISLC